MWHRYRLRVLVLLMLGLLYGAMIQKYRAYDVDDPWVLSYSYNACHGGGEEDAFTGFPFAYGGMDGVHLFGKVPAAVQCIVLNRTGWTLWSAVCLSIAFGLGALLLWWLFLLRLGYRDKQIAVFISLLGLTEPIMSLMEKARYEFLSFFLLSAALWLGVQGWELAALLLAMLTVETHPASIAIVVPVMLLLLLRTKSIKLLLFRFLASCIVMFALYQYLHPVAILEMVHTRQHTEIALGGTLRSYFIMRYRHLPELAMLLVGAWLYWRERARISDRTIAWMALAVAVMLFLIPHLNPAYMVFGMPFFLLTALQGYGQAPHWRWVPALVFAGIILQYGYLYRTNIHEGFSAQDFAAVRQRIADSESILHIQDQDAHICGDYSLWFAHPRNYSTCMISWQPVKLAEGNLFLCFDGPSQGNGLLPPETPYCSDRREEAPLHEISSMVIRGHVLHFYARS